MKLPEGKVKDTFSGGVDILKRSINKFKKENFSGYLLIRSKDENGELEGQVVFQDGEPVLSEFISPDKTFSGEKSVIPIIESCLNSESTYEIHTSIDVELMIRFFSKAKVTIDVYNVDKRLQELKDLEEKEKEKTEQLKKELELRKTLEEKLQVWKGDGYVVTKLEKVFKEPLETVEKEFKKFENGVNKLTELDERLSKIENEEYKEKVADIEAKLNNPDLISEIESELTNLEQTISEQDERRKELQKIIDEWKEAGYNVSKLADLLETDLDKAWDEFTGVMDTIQKLKEYEEMVNTIKAKGFEKKIESIKSKIKDITALDSIKKEYSDLESRLKEESEKKERLKILMNSWKDQGFKLDKLSSILDEPFETAEEKFMDYEKKVETLKDIKNRVEKLDKTELEEEIEELSPNLTDPEIADELNEKISELEKKNEQLKTKKESLHQLLGDLKDQGFNVSDLERVIDGKLDIIIKKFEEFEEKKKKLDEIRKELEGLDTRDFPEETEQIKSQLKDIESIKELNNQLSELKEKIEADEEQRKDIEEKIKELSEEGFVVIKIEEKMKESFKTFRDAFIAFLDDIQKLKEYKTRLEELSAPGYEKEIESLTEKFKDPENLPSLEKDIEELVEKINKESERRDEIKSKLESWKEEGFDVTQLEEGLKSPLDDLEKTYSETEENINKLNTLGEQLESLDTKWHEEEANKIKDQLKNPSLIIDTEKTMAELVDILDKEQHQRKELKDQLERWREEGYNVAMMDNVMDQHVDKISEIAVTLNDNINKLKDFDNRLDALETKWFEKETVALQEKLKDPEKIEEITTELEGLETKVEENKKRREELKSKYEDWKSQGFNVEPLEGVLDKEISEVEKSFETFEKDLEQLIELQKKMGIKPPAPGEGKEKVKGKDKEKKTEPVPEEEKAKAEKEEPVKKDQVISSGMELISDFVFDSFVVGASNRFTHAAALAVAETPAEAYNPLFVYGGVGLGKTHLLNAIGNHVLENHSDLNVVYTTSEKFTNELINSIRYDKIEEFRNIYRTADILIIDDIQFLAGKESTQEEFFHTFNALYTAHKQIVISSDRPPRDIPQLEERLKSRFEGGLITDIQPPSLETKIIILRREAKKHNVDVPDEVMHIIASKVKSNIRELRGALTKIIAYSKLIKQQITEDIAKEVLKDFIGEKPTARIQVAEAEEEAPVMVKETGGTRVSGGLSSIEKRLSSLKKKLSPILRDKGEKKKVEEDLKLEKPGAPEAESADESPAPAAEKPGPDTGVAPASGEGDLPQEPPSAPPAEPEADAGETDEDVELAKCGNCGELIPGNVVECPNCGVSFADESYECPMCRAIVSGDSNRCENCGAEFEMVEEAPAEEKKKKKKKKKA